jgi:hypothetical protein
MVRKAAELAKKHGWFLARQFENQANPRIHRNTTGPESCATSRQAARFLGHRLGHGRHADRRRRHDPQARVPRSRIVVTEPAAHRCSRREWKPHKIQGWTPDFVPAVLDRTWRTRSCRSTDDEAIQTSRALASKEGIFCGISSGGTFAAALKVAQKARRRVILAMLPDTGERYLTTALFEGISDASDAEPANSFTLNDSLQPGDPRRVLYRRPLSDRPARRRPATKLRGLDRRSDAPSSNVWQRGSEILFLSFTSRSAGRRRKADRIRDSQRPRHRGARRALSYWRRVVPVCGRQIGRTAAGGANAKGGRAVAVITTHREKKSSLTKSKRSARCAPTSS